MRIVTANSTRGPAWVVLWLCLAAISALCHAADTATIVVDAAHPRSGDSNAGTADAPLKTIGRAVAIARPGQTVLIQPGTYREQVDLTASGTPQLPITLKAAPGGRAIISGADIITGWRRCAGNDLPGHPNAQSIWYVDLPQRPVNLYFAGRPADLALARWPRNVPSEGRIAGGYRGPTDAWPVEDGDDKSLIDAAHLTQPKGAWEGGQLVVVHFNITDGRFRGDTKMIRTISAYDPDKHRLSFAPAVQHSLGKLARGEHRQWYYIQNLPSLIAGPGEYAIRESGADRVRFYLWPPANVNLETTVVEGSVRKHAILADKVAHVRIEGLEVTRTVGTGIRLRGGHDNLVQRCLACYCRMGAQMEAAAGIELMGERNTVVTNCVSILNGYGIMQSGCQDTRVEGNASGHNIVDALVLSWRSRGVRIARNYAFDAWSLGHPDGFQTYRDVQKLTLEANLFLSVGQGWQCAETQDALVTHNVWAGIHYGNAISCSLRKAIVGDVNRRNRFANNTIFAGAVGTGGESVFINNIVMPPSGGGARSEQGVSGKPVESDYNLMWSHLPGYEFKWEPGGGQKAQTSKDFAAWIRGTGLNAHSKFAAPRFRNGPLFQAKFDDGETGSGKAKLQLGHGGSAGFEVGDLVEIDVDGVRRTVREVGDGFIVLDPPPQSIRGGLSILWNWKRNPNFDQLDLRTADDSPGKAMTADGRDVGANIDIPAYMRGDFDGDGRCDLPPIPADLKAEHPRLARFCRW